LLSLPLTIALFLAIALFAPLPSLLLPSPSSSSLPATLVAITTALFFAFAIAHLPALSLVPLPCYTHPLCRLLIVITIALIVPHHSHCCRHCPCCHSPTTFVAIAIALATVAIAIVITCHPCRHCNRPLCCLCLHLPATLVAVAPPFGGGGEDNTNPARDPTLATAASATIIIAAFAARTTSWERPVKQHAGIQCPTDSVRQHGGAAVSFCEAGVILHANQQRRRWRHADSGGCSIGNAATGNQVNKDNDNNMTTTQ
jgi:hypothetical protein